MNYELAKQLKDAGYEMFYPEYPEEGCELFEDGWRLPRLSELIEACGPEFVTLVRWEDNFWVASNCERLTPMIEKGLDIHGKGKTPEEAVAKFWLERHKDKNV